VRKQLLATFQVLVADLGGHARDVDVEDDEVGATAKARVGDAGNLRLVAAVDKTIGE
jgi:hypothetical protein